MPLEEVIRTYFQAYKNKDRATVESLLADDFEFTSPYDVGIDRKTYFERCWPYSEKSPVYEIEHVIDDGDVAFVLYEVKTKDGGKSRNTEFFVMGNGKIKEIQVYFGNPPTAAKD